MEKSFLFDVVSRIYVATDSNPVHMATYELCCDMIDVAIDVSCIYGVSEEVRQLRHAMAVAGVAFVHTSDRTDRDLPDLDRSDQWDGTHV